MTGERGERGPPGEQGDLGEPGARGRRGAEGPSRRYGPLYGYIVASLIFTVLIYALLFAQRADSVTNCEQRNAQIAEVNKRAKVINDLIKLERTERDEHSPEALRVLEGDSAIVVPLTDCDATFDHPWPF